MAPFGAASGALDPAGARERFRGSIVGTAVGDALGAPFEGHPAVRPDDVARWAAAPGLLRWTDDTAMTIGLAESLIACRGFDGADLAQRFATAYFAEPNRGYGAGPPRIFAAIRDGAAWQEPAQALFGGQGSFGNGAAMRAAPAGLFARGDLGRAADLARKTALVTHAHEIGRQGAAVQACAVALLATADAPDRGGLALPLIERLRAVADAPEYQAAFDVLADAHDRLAAGEDVPGEEVAVRVGTGISAAEAVPAALHAALTHPASFADAVIYAICLGGDTDTIAAMTGAQVGALLGYRAIPQAWLERLEGHDQLVALADDLLDVTLDF